MKRLLLLVCLVPLWAHAETATIRVDVDRVIDQIDPKIYGVFMEPIGFNRGDIHFNSLYGPLYDPASPLADEHGFRRDMLDAARELQITNMRWPGGNFTSSYDWRDGIGPKAQRPKRRELAWGVVEPNQVGTDEWVQLNKLLGTENVVCFNGGTGSIMDASAWVEYCNAPVGSYWSDKRAEYGHPEPYGIKYWCLGNEVDGAPWIIAFKDAEDYIKWAVETAKAVRRTVPGAEFHFIANGSSNYKDNIDWVDWNWKVIKALYGTADYVSIHRYWDKSDDYYVLLGQRAMDLDEKITITANQIKAVSAVQKKKPMYVSLDEWAPPFMGGHLSTLAVAEYFNAFIRHADVLKMANYTALTSILSRDFKSPDKVYKSPTFYAFKLFSTQCRGAALDPTVTCGTFGTSDYYTKIPYLDVSAVHDAKAKRVIINVVNRHQTDAIATDIATVTGTFSGPATVSQIASDDIKNTPYTYEDRDKYPPTTAQVPASGATLRYTFPAHSFTQIVVGVDR